MLNFNDDRKNMSLEQLRSKHELLRTELKALGEKAEKRAKDFTSDDSRRVSDITDWIDQATARADQSGSPAGQDSIPSVSASEQRDKYLQYGQFLQAAAAANTPAGSKFGAFDSGRIYRNVLEPETRASGMGESIPSEGGLSCKHGLCQ